MVEVADALEIVLSHARALPAVVEALGPALVGRVLGADVTADRDSPPFDKSLRDGYAVRSADRFDATFRIVEEIPAGAVPKNALGEGECARIFTGAPLPAGADAVVMQEDAEADGDRVRLAVPRPGQWLYRRGTEMWAGDVVLSAGTVLTPAALGVLAGVGLAAVRVPPRPRVAVFATGDELVGAGDVPGPGQIRNTNSPLLTALAADTGATARDHGIVRDTRELLRAALAQALDDTDVLLVAGGVSVGSYDLVPEVLSELGVEAHVRQVRMKPGKPLLFGTRGRTLVFGLPGNPVSGLVCFELFVRPALLALGGNSSPGPRTVLIPLAAAVAESNDRPTYRPATLEPADVGWAVCPLPGGTAPDLLGTATADSLLVLPAGETRWDAGTPVPVVLMGGGPFARRPMT